MLANRFAATVRSSAGAVSRGRVVYQYRPTAANPHMQKSSTQGKISKLSTSRPEPPAKQSTNSSSKQPEEPPPMGFSFEGLGMSRNTKIAVIVILSIFGTMESIFYIRWIWRWLSGTKGEDKDETESKA